MKTMLKNHLGDTSVTSYLPMTVANAQTLVEDVCEGTWALYEESSQSGNDTGYTVAYDTTVQYRNSGTNKKGYLRFIAKSTVNPDEIQTVLSGMTINGILIDEVVITSFRPLSFA